MCTENIFIAGRYNKFLRNLSQSPWIDKDDTRIKHSVQELIEEGLKKFLRFDKCVFSSSGREDVDVRMLGRGRPFVFRIINPFNPTSFNNDTFQLIENHINRMHFSKIRVRDLQIVSKTEVSKNLKEGQESKTKEYRALCCCSRILTQEDFDKIKDMKEFTINQKTPIRVLHRRSLATRRRMIHRMHLEKVNLGEFDSINEEHVDKVFALILLTEAGTYIKEFVHGDFGRTEPSLATILGNCDTDLIDLDVMEVYSDWPPEIIRLPDQVSSTDMANDVEKSEINLEELHQNAMKSMDMAKALPRGDERQGHFLQARRQFEQVLGLVESSNLFSENETIEDVATNNLKYLIIEAHLAKIALSSECGPNRLETFAKAEDLIKRFLERLSRYGLVDTNMEQALYSDRSFSQGPSVESRANLESAIQARNEKIEKYKRMKLLDDRLSELDRLISSGTQLDDENLREYYLNLIKRTINESFESLEHLVRPALFFERNKDSSSVVPDSASTMKQPLTSKPKMFTIVKDQLQKKVIGLGYPSKPTITVDEFISKKISDGNLAFHSQKQIYSNSLQRYAENPNLIREQEEDSDIEHEEKEERDDTDELKRKRQWDEFKDDNPRGSGNRHNMG